MFKNKSKNLVYALLLFVPLILFFLRSDSFTPVKFGLIKIVSSPMEILSFPFREIKKILYYHRTFKEYKRLNEEVGTLKTRLVGLEEVIRENTRYQKLLEFKRTLIYASVAANVVGREPNNWNSSMIIDKGAQDGVKEGASVVNAWGVVGKVVEVGPTASKVMLLTDPQFSVAALTQSSRESGLVGGSLQGLCRLRYLNPQAPIEIGEKVITSQLSTSFPENLLIGEITSLDQDPEGNYAEAVVKPSVNLSQLEEVLVILNR